MSDLFCYLALAQGFYFLATGLWAIIDITSFMKVTGPKTDVWLVKTVGVLVCVIAVPLIIAGLNKRLTPEVYVLGVGSAAALTGVDVWYVARRVIPPIYLADAAAELVLIGVWAYLGVAGGVF